MTLYVRMIEVFSMQNAAGKAGEAVKDHNLYSELNLSIRNTLLSKILMSR